MTKFDTTEITTYEELVDLIRKSQLKHDLSLISKAYEFAKEAHAGQKRLTGEDYIVHSLNVAKYIVQLDLDTTSIVAALIHDVTDNGTKTIDEVDKTFGTEVAFIVDGVTNIREFSKKYIGVDENDVENFKHLILNSTEDIRVLIIRIAEKMHNVQSMHVLPEEKKVLSATRIIRVYAQLCEYLGLSSFQRILQDKAFEVIKPEEYEITKNTLTKHYEESEDIIEGFANAVDSLCKKANVKAKISSRKKGIYSSYSKVKRKYLKKDEALSSKSFDHLNDILAIRVIVNNIEECFLTLGLIHANWEFVQSEFDDYITNPKVNGYRSIHTVVKFENKNIEVQIRTSEMHEFDEYGAASHISYKLHGSEKVMDEPTTWTKDMVSWKEKSQLSKEDFKIKVFAESIFVFTPKGLVIRLDDGATPLDFAFEIHTDIGYRYTGAIVNNKMESLSYKLQTGDVIEILTGKKINVNRDWLKYVFNSLCKKENQEYVEEDGRRG